MRTISIYLFLAAPALVSAATLSLHKRIGGAATFYYTQTGNAGSCGSYLSDSGFTVAMNQVQYTDSMCGQTITITANGKTAQATIMDLCPTGGGNCNYGDMDMSPGLFQYFASLDAGKISIEWDFGGGSPPPPPTTAPQQDTPPPDTTTYYQPPPPDTATTTSAEYQWSQPTTVWQPPTTTWEPPAANSEPPTTSLDSSWSSSSSSSSSLSSYTSSSSSAPATSASADLTVQNTQQSQSTGGNLAGLGEAFVNIGSMLRYAGGNGA